MTRISANAVAPVDGGLADRQALGEVVQAQTDRGAERDVARGDALGPTGAHRGS